MVKGFIVIVACMLLSACMSSHHHDGPPNFYVDERRIPNAIPKLEPLSKIGNKPHYTVFGQRYNVLPTSFAYNEIGIASWYGTLFHARHTSNGELYDMLAMTAAHKTLPLPTYVEVTNLKNRKRIIVKVNDRGPFEANRIIDLSYVAAKKLGMIGHGTTLVRVRSIDPRDAFTHPELMARKQNYVPRISVQPKTHLASGQVHLPHYSPRNYAVKSPAPKYKKRTVTATRWLKDRNKAVLPAGVHRVARNNNIQDISGHTLAVNRHQVYIQVGAFKNQSSAQDLKLRLIAFTHVPVNINPTKHLYRVQIGPIKDMLTATKLSQHLRKKGIPIQALGYRDDRIVETFDVI